MIGVPVLDGVGVADAGAGMMQSWILPEHFSMTLELHGTSNLRVQ
jgi:hypothetical protein